MDPQPHVFDQAEAPGSTPGEGTVLPPPPDGLAGRLRYGLSGMLDMVRYDRRTRVYTLAAAAAVAVVAAAAFLLTTASDGPDAAAPEPPRVLDTVYSQPAAQHFAQVENGVVVDVAVVDRATLLASPDRYPGVWVETFPDGSARGVFASPGYLYDEAADMFYPPQPFPSWTLSPQGSWEPPVPRPDGSWIWDEPSLSWQPRP